MSGNFRSRLLQEEIDIRKKIDSLKGFILSQFFDSLPEIDRKDLKEQLQHMEQYHAVLVRRVSRQCGDA